MFQEHWTSPRTWFWRHEPCLLALPFGTTARNLHLVDLECCQALAWLPEDTLPHSLTRFASYWLILLRYLMVSWMGWVGKHELMLSHVSEHAILSCALQGCIQSPSLPWLLAGCPWIQDFWGKGEHVCCHVFPPAHVFPSGLGNTPVTKTGGSPFPHGGAILDVSGFTKGSVVCDPTTCNDDAGIISICSSASTNVLALLGKKPL